VSTETARLRLERLRDRPEAVDGVARWWFDEWGHESPGLTLDALRARVRASLDAVLPETVVAVRGDRVVGVAELKAHELRDAFPERTPWLGGVFVDPSHRGAGIAAALVREIERIAREAGFRHLWLQTEATGGGLYARIGWRPDVLIEAHGVPVRVMERTFAD
jgi:GNAT superfamily N-acetyltransferase